MAYLGDPASAAELVFGGEHSLFRQSWAPRELLSGSVNADGYGVVWYAADGPARIAESRPIWYDEEDLRRTLGSLRSACMIAALRNGTPGIPVDRSGLLPLVVDRWSFVLNGFVPDFRRRHMRALRRDLPDHLYGSLTGVSDSETLFLMTLAAIDGGATPGDALVDTVGRVRRRVGSDEAQLNMVLSDGQSIAAVRTGTGGRTNSLYLAEKGTRMPAGTLLASERPNADEAWVEVGDHELVLLGSRGGGVTRSAILAK
jgi:glutamine amidotransferase